MAKEEYKQFSCADIGMACGFQVRAKTDEEIMEHAKIHAKEAHGINEVPPDLQKKIKANIKQVTVDLPEK